MLLLDQHVFPVRSVSTANSDITFNTTNFSLFVSRYPRRSTNLVPLFPWIWRGLNAIGRKVFGLDLIPVTMLTDVDGLRRAASENDISYGGERGCESRILRHIIVSQRRAWR